MLKHYLKIALRNLRRNRAYALINVAGLAVGIASVLLIILFVQDERHYDRHHVNADRIYRVTVWSTNDGQTQRHAVTPAPLAPAIERDVPGVEHTVRFSHPSMDPLRCGEHEFVDQQMLSSDPSISKVFSLSFIHGNPDVALSHPNTAVVTQTLAQKCFGSTNPLGQTLYLRREPDQETALEVTGVIKDMPSASSLVFDVLIPLVPRYPDEWSLSEMTTFVLLDEQHDAAYLDQQLTGVARRYQSDQVERSRLDYSSQPLTQMHLYDLTENGIEPNGRYDALYTFSLVAAFILLLACINYINLATARSVERSHEIGVRKVTGARRWQIVHQFVVESFLFSGLALVLVMALIALVLPWLNDFSGKSIGLEQIEGVTLLGGIALFLLICAATAGYPSLLLSAFDPVRVLRGWSSRSAGGAAVRRGLTVFQFVICIVLLTATLVIYRQITYLRTTNHGFDKEHLLILEVMKARSLQPQMTGFKQELLRHANILGATASRGVPTRMFVYTSVAPDSLEDRKVNAWQFDVDRDFGRVYALRPVAGQLDDFGQLSGGALIANAAFVKEAYGVPAEEVIGRRVPNYGPIVAVVEDFHFETLREQIQPIFLFYHSNFVARSPNGHVSLRVRPEGLPETLAYIERTYHTFAPEQPFSYFFMDEAFDALYKSEEKQAQLFLCFTVLAILIAGLGLLGLTAFTIERRTREMGIRKALGATTKDLMILLSNETWRLALISFVLAVPIAYVGIQSWLDDFAYRVELSGFWFLVAGLAVFSLAIVTVGYHSIRVARANPVDALRTE